MVEENHSHFEEKDLHVEGFAVQNTFLHLANTSNSSFFLSFLQYIYLTLSFFLCVIISWSLIGDCPDFSVV